MCVEFVSQFPALRGFFHEIYIVELKKSFLRPSALTNDPTNGVLVFFSRDTVPAHGRHFVLKRHENKKTFRLVIEEVENFQCCG